MDLRIIRAHARRGGLLAARILGVVVGAATFLLSAMRAYDEVLFHGFGNNCSDGNPEYDPAICGITWQPGFPYLALAAAGFALVLVSGWSRTLTRRTLLVAGVLIVVQAVFLLWADTWDPVNPAEPAGPQVVLLGLGVVLLMAGRQCRNVKSGLS
jgi:hypothetical protein